LVLTGKLTDSLALFGTAAVHRSSGGINRLKEVTNCLHGLQNVDYKRSLSDLICLGVIPAAPVHGRRLVHVDPKLANRLSLELALAACVLVKVLEDVPGMSRTFSPIAGAPCQVSAKSRTRRRAGEAVPLRCRLGVAGGADCGSSGPARGVLEGFPYLAGMSTTSSSPQQSS
jgi:hypothetical protein